MNDEGTDVLTQVWEQLEVAPPPTASLITRGRRLRRGRTAWAVGVVAVMAAVPIAVSVVAGHGTSAPQTPAASDTPSHLAVPGPTRVVASGAVAVTVPRSWVNLQPYCSPPTRDHVSFESHVIVNCTMIPSSPTPPPEPDSLYVTTLSTDRDAARTLRPATTDGLQVLESPVRCSDDMCEQSVAIESHDALFTVRVSDDQRGLLDAITSSVTVVPDGYVGVPYIDPGTSLATAKRIMREAGLTFSADPSLLDYLSLELRPAAGSVVPVGTAVTAHADG